MTTPALALSDVRKSFGKTEIIRGVNLAVPAGERHAIIGPNGAGKSTLFNLISGRFAVSSGSIALNGQETTRLKPFEINRRGLSRSFQITNIFHRMSVFENIRCATLYALGYRYSFWHRLSRLRDAAERAGVRLQVSHLVPRPGAPDGALARSIEHIDRAADRGLDVAFDVHTRLFGFTNLAVALPRWVVDGGPDGLVLSGNGDPLDALRALCVRHWDTGGGPLRVRAHGDDAAAALRALGLAAATVAGADAVPRSS